MKKSVLLVTIVAILSLSAFGQRFEDLSFNLTAMKPQALPLEPIPFKLRVTNNTETPITIDTGLSFQTSAVSLEIRKPNGKSVTLTQLSHIRGRSFVIPRPLAPGASLEATQLFDFKTQTYFGKPGQYEVRASYNNKKGETVQSGWVLISIVEPVGNAKAAHEFLAKKMSRTFSPFTSWDTDDLEEFVAQYPDNSYTDYERYSLAERFFEKEKNKAEAQLRQIQDSTFFYADQVTEKLKKIESKRMN